jgi:hypothetical protein
LQLPDLIGSLIERVFFGEDENSHDILEALELGVQYLGSDTESLISEIWEVIDTDVSKVAKLYGMWFILLSIVVC